MREIAWRSGSGCGRHAPIPLSSSAVVGAAAVGESATSLTVFDESPVTTPSVQSSAAGRTTTRDVSFAKTPFFLSSVTRDVANTELSPVKEAARVEAAEADPAVSLLFDEHERGAFSQIKSCAVHLE